MLTFGIQKKLTMTARTINEKGNSSYFHSTLQGIRIDTISKLTAIAECNEEIKDDLPSVVIPRDETLTSFNRRDTLLHIHDKLVSAPS